MRRIKLPNGGHLLCPPFTKAEQQELMRQIAGSGGPRMVAWPRGLRTAGSATAATNHQTEATSQSVAEAAADQARPNLPPEKD